VHNTFPLISPAVYAAARDGGAAVVQTLHNFRTLCVKAQLLRDGAVCEDCVGRAVPWPGVVHRCYRDSLVASGAAATMLTVHRAAGTWRRAVDRYVALTGFARDKFVAGGLPAARIAVKPNFLDSPAPAAAGPEARSGGLFVGRLSPEKGIGVLAAALARGPVPLRIAGEGPVAVAAAPDLTLLGRIDAGAVAREMAAAAYLVVPSVWYEGFPMVIVEAFARGLPVIASRIGSLAEIVEDGVTGLLAAPGDAADLAAKMRWAHEHPGEMAAMGRAARARYEALYTPERNYAMLMEIYAAARAQAASA
ncbi:MAG: glycosyltransferase, partial [Rhodospirillaceae bacterium]